MTLLPGQGRPPKLVDLRAQSVGQGLATSPQVLLAWKASRWPPPSTASATIPQPPSTPGRQFPNRAFKPIKLQNSQFSQPGPNLYITASDPFTSPAYLARTGLPCLKLSFADVAEGHLPRPPDSAISTAGRDTIFEPFDVVVVSFALHLVETNSELWALLSELSKRARWLIVTAPHKKPDVCLPNHEESILLTCRLLDKGLVGMETVGSL